MAAPQRQQISACACGSALSFADCCGRYLAGAAAPTAEALMRSRYTAFTRQDEAYLLATWHPDTRPARLDLHLPPVPKWLGLKIIAQQLQNDTHATVEFVARSKIAGRAQRLHEISRFERVEGRWFYLNAAMPDQGSEKPDD
jgi:SEC-C motif-containing protein